MNSEVPQEWRDAEIRPILKRGKDPSDPASFRPVSLTSVLGKTMERVINQRLKYHLESHELLTPNQAGFRARRSTEDQVLRLAQEVSDGFQQKPMKRTVLALLDFSKAYDTVWRVGLLWKMKRMGFSSRLIRWCQSWLSNRQNRVCINSSQSKPANFKFGVPQGSVISPVLFLIYINDIEEGLPAGSSISLYADDVAIWATDCSLVTAQRRVEEAVQHVATWSHQWYLTLSLNKCECSFFSTNTHEANWTPRIIVDNHELPFNATPKFLGVTFDRQLTFTPHTSSTVKKMRQTAQVLRAVTATDWGCERDTLRATYLAVGRTTMEYAAPGWMPWLAESNIERLETAQRECARVVAGTVKTTPREGVLAEAGLLPVKTTALRRCIQAYQKSLHLEESNPRRVTTSKTGKQRTKKADWRNHCRERWRRITENKPHQWDPFPAILPPWRELKQLQFHRVEGKKREDPAENRVASLRLLDQRLDDITIYTDGSAANGTEFGGAGVVVTTGSAMEPEVIHREQAPAGKMTSSFASELLAFRMALQWLHHNADFWTTARVVTDSMATWERARALSNTSRLNNKDERAIAETLAALKEMEGDKEIHIYWCPSHCDVPGNELADHEAALASDHCRRAPTEEAGSVSFAVAKAAIARAITKPEIQHERLRNTYGAQPRSDIRVREETHLSRPDQVELSRLRTEHHPELRAWRRKMELEDCGADGECRLCGHPEETATHIVLECRAVDVERQRLEIRGRQAFIKQPQEVVRLWRRWREVAEEHAAHTN
jgi:ribonuclease HI